MTLLPLRARPARSALAALAAVLFLAGCDDGIPPPETADPDAARSTLQRALEAWQSGQTIAQAKDATPSIIAADPLWEQGRSLSKFEILGAAQESGAEQVFDVKLWVTDADGNESEQTVAYRVGTQPVLTVFRALF